MYKDIFESIRNEAEKRNLRERTIQLYCSDVSYFLRWIGKNVSDLTLEDAESFLTAKRLEGRSPETHNHYRSAIKWSYVKKKYKLNVTNFLCSERSLTCYFYYILLDVFKILFLIFIWRQISTMTVNAHGIVKCFDVFKNQFMCMCIIKDFKPVDPFSLQKCMERFDTGVIPWICFL